MSENLCLRCQLELDRSDQDGFYAPLAHKLLDAEPASCAWAALSDAQREYLTERGVDAERFCQLRQRATGLWLAEWDRENDIVGWRTAGGRQGDMFGDS